MAWTWFVDINQFKKNQTDVWCQFAVATHFRVKIYSTKSNSMLYPFPSQKKAQHGNLNVDEDDPFDLFIAATNIRFCYYKETHKILGNTYGMCVLQDFEAITPNLLGESEGRK